jgi:hypothetical protein
MAEYLHDFEALVRYLERTEEAVMLEEGRVVFRVRLEGDRRGRLEIAWDARIGVLDFFLPLPLQFAEARRHDMAVAVSALNTHLGILGFQLAGNGVGFATHLYLSHEGSFSTLALDKTIEACRNTARTFFRDLERVAKAQPAGT